MIKAQIRKYYYFITLPFGVVLLLLGFFGVEDIVIPVYKINIFIDDFIPTVEGFVYIYLLWYVYLVWGIIYLGVHSRKQYYRLGLILLVGAYICYLFYIIFPNYVDLRTEVISSGLTGYLMNWLHSVDNCNNVFPSLHVFAAVSVFTAVHCWKKSQKKVWDKIDVLSFLLVILICSSTVFIKQHSILDVVSGILFSSIMWSLFSPRRVLKIIYVLDPLIRKVINTELIREG